ncbi:hypothetical protein EYR40_010663 [Pleurotus pulmonarius]|nr:hypothetical protein EYR36_002437 [Pleurotus pulmonarius]KAF4586648.1 hypothetical protein EYR40_010663 [Pleurotus pulmonarius]
MFWEIAAAAAGLWVLKSMASINKARKSLGDCPGGEIMALHPFRTLSLVLGSHFPFPGQIGSYFGKFSLYQKYGSTCLSSIVFSNAIPTFWLSDADAIKVVSTDRTVFQKDVEAYETLNIYGPNLVGTEGLDWKRHRRIANPAFNEANNAFVWSETTRFIAEWFTEIDKSQAGNKAIPIDLLKDLTQLTLLIISSAGFSRRVSWNDDSSLVPPPGHAMAFQPAVASAIHHTIVKILTPDFLYSLCSQINIPFISPLLRETTTSFEALRMHMLEVVSSARAWILDNKGATKDGKMDAALLRNLVEANLAEGSDYRGLTDDELLSNTFTFLLAGHETSAHTLCFAIVFLALYPDVQDKIYEEAARLWPDGVPEVADLSSYKDSMPKLEYTIASFHETLRHFPSVARLGKPVHADTTLKAKRFTTNIQHTKPKSTDLQELSDVEEFVVPIPKGSIVIVDIFALHFNPLYWGPDVTEFRPDRFIDTESYRWPRDAFLAFSSGPRSCIGQRFSTTESACILASLVRKYEILVPGDLKSLPFEERKKVMLGCTTGITLTPTNARVELKRRT